MCLNAFCGWFLILRFVRKLSLNNINQTTCGPSESEIYRPVGTLLLQKVHKKLQNLITLDQKQSGFCGFCFFQKRKIILHFSAHFSSINFDQKGPFFPLLSFQKANNLPLSIWVKTQNLNDYLNVFFHIKSIRFTSFHNKNCVWTQPEKMCVEKIFCKQNTILSKKLVEDYFWALRIG